MQWCGLEKRLCGLKVGDRCSVTWVVGSVSSWLSASRSKGYLLHESIKCASAFGNTKFGNTLFFGTNHEKY
jgi:hypothetical protein